MSMWLLMPLFQVWVGSTIRVDTSPTSSRQIHRCIFPLTTPWVGLVAIRGFVRRIARNQFFGFQKVEPTMVSFPSIPGERDIYSKRDTMKRVSREVSTSTRQKIAQGVRKAHAQRTEAEKQRTRELQSASAKRYWATIPKKGEEDEPEVDTTYAW